MKHKSAYSKFVNLIKKEEFVSLFSSCENPEMWFSGKELQEFPFPERARSLAGRYLIKKTICDQIKEQGKMHEIEILNNSFGKPEISLGINIQTDVHRKGIKEILCSISHSRNFITSLTIFCF